MMHWGLRLKLIYGDDDEIKRILLMVEENAHEGRYIIRQFLLQLGVHYV